MSRESGFDDTDKKGIVMKNQQDKNVKHKRILKDMIGRMRNEDKEKARRKEVRRQIVIVLVTAAALLAMLVGKSYKSQVKRWNTRTEIDKIIEDAEQRSAVRNDEIYKDFSCKLKQLTGDRFNLLYEAADAASRKVSGYGTCVKLIKCMAYDKIRRKDTTDRYIVSKVEPIIKPAEDALSREVNQLLVDMERELIENRSRMKAGIIRQIQAENIDIDVSSLFTESSATDGAVFNLGISGGTAALSAVFDAKVAVVSTSKLVQLLAEKIFSRQVAEAGATAIAPAVDGPLPVGDVIAVFFGAWTIYDISHSRKTFEKEIRISLCNSMDQELQKVSNMALKRAENICAQYNITGGH